MLMTNRKKYLIIFNKLIIRICAEIMNKTDTNTRVCVVLIARVVVQNTKCPLCVDGLYFGKFVCIHVSDNCSPHNRLNELQPIYIKERERGKK